MVLQAVTTQARYRIVVEWAHWRVAQDGGDRIERVDECTTAGILVVKLGTWMRAPGASRVWYESLGSDGVWRFEGRAA